MNKDSILERVSMIMSDMKICQDTYVKLQGALIECQHWLQELEKDNEHVDFESEDKKQVTEDGICVAECEKVSD